jgi:hypothetical protein
MPRFGERVTVIVRTVATYEPDKNIFRQVTDLAPLATKLIHFANFSNR